MSFSANSTFIGNQLKSGSNWYDWDIINNSNMYTYTGVWGSDGTYGMYAPSTYWEFSATN